MLRARRFGFPAGNATVAVTALLLVGVAAVPVVLHFGQKAHNRLDFDVDRAFPPGEKFVPGEIFATTLIAIMDHELSSPTGWRPNDFFLWGPGLLADNNANRQLGIIQAFRESLRVFKDNLTKVSATGYDENLVEADKMFRNDERKFWFPSAESRFRKGIEYLQRYVEGLHADPPTSKPINGRNAELLKLFQAWTDLLGAAHADLYREREPGEGGKPGPRVPPWRTDDYFYRAQGYAHVMAHLMHAVRREYAASLQERPVLQELFAEVIDALGKAAVLKPLIVLDGRPDGLFANHRRNLAAYVVEARQKMYSIRDELEK